MKRKKIDSFTLFVILLLALILTLLGMLLAGMKEEKRQFTVLLPLGDLAYDEDFLQKAKKIKGIKEIWPVIEVPVVIKIEDYTETTTFSGIDMNAFGKNPTQNELGKMPLLLLGNGSLRDMKDYNNHAISKKQQEKFLEMGENLNIFYFLDEKEKDTSKATDDLTTLSGNSAREPQWFLKYQKQPMYRSQRTVSAVNMPWSRLPLKWAGSMKKKSSAKWQQVHTEQV